MRLHHRQPHRDEHKRIAAAMSARGVDYIPGKWLARLYDDKVEQSRQLAKWLPETFVVETAEEAGRLLDEGRMAFPFVSKASEGASSQNVRLVRDEAQARAEIADAFGPGLAKSYHEKQHNYLLWQRFCPGNDYDFRCIRIGSERLIFRRYNRPDVPFASGSGREEVRKGGLDDELEAALAHADAFFAAGDFRWCGIDLVKDEGRFVVLECTVGWPNPKPKWPHLTVSGRPWLDMWKIAVEEIEKGAFA